MLNTPATDYPVLGIPAWLLITAITNVVYGFVICLIFSIVNMATERQPKTYTCGVCNPTFGTKEELKSHARTHRMAERQPP